jgi:hypothetical protein
MHKEVVALLATARELLAKDPEVLASMLQSMMSGVSRRVLESSAPERHFAELRPELLFLARVYVQACAASAAA